MGKFPQDGENGKNVAFLNTISKIMGKPRPKFLQNSWENLKKPNRLVTAELQKKLKEYHILTIFPVLGKLTLVGVTGFVIMWQRNTF